MKPISDRPFFRYQLPLYLYIAAIFGASSIPGSSMPHGPSLPIDKVAHLVEYGILGFLLFRVITSFGRMPLKLSVMLIIFCAAVLGALDESYQSITGRSPSVYDWLFDCLGAIVSSCLLAGYTRVRKTQA